MTISQIMAACKSELGDPGIFFTDRDLVDYIQDGYEEIAFLTECIEKLVVLNWEPSITYVNIRTSVPDYFRVFAIYDLHQKLWLEPISYKVMRTYSGRWQSQAGLPRYFSPLGFDTVAFFPQYDYSPSLGYRLFYKAMATDITGLTELEIPVENEQVIVDYVVSSLWDQQQEFTKSQYHYNFYVENLDRLKKRMEGRDIVDRIPALVQRYANMG